VCCSVRCRQARHRFARAAGRAEASCGAAALRLAYADPPYPGNAGLYRGHPDYAGEVDHAELVARLAGYDGWALSTSAAALPAVLALCPAGARVAAWHRGERPNGASRRPLNAWEPLIYHGGRQASPAAGDDASRPVGARRVDSLVCGVSAMTTLPGRVVGAKPAAFCRWVFDLLGARPGDTLDDLFPGSGAVGLAWAVFVGGPDPSSSAAGDTSQPGSPSPREASRRRDDRPRPSPHHGERRTKGATSTVDRVPAARTVAGPSDAGRRSARRGAKAAKHAAAPGGPPREPSREPGEEPPSCPQPETSTPSTPTPVPSTARTAD
jgi:hypothetical protein